MSGIHRDQSTCKMNNRNKRHIGKDEGRQGSCIGKEGWDTCIHWNNRNTVEADSLLSGQFYLRPSLQKSFFNSHKTLYFYISISRQYLCQQAAVDTFRVYKLDFNFVLGSCKLTLKNYLPLNLAF